MFCIQYFVSTITAGVIGLAMPNLISNHFLGFRLHQFNRIESLNTKIILTKLFSDSIATNELDNN